MRRGLLILGMALGVVASRGLAAPRLLCETPVHDFGVVTGQEEVTHTFILRNTGDEPLTIQRVRATCGCTTTGLASDTIAPGGQVELATRLSLKGRRGEQRKAIYIDSNDAAQPNYRLELLADVHHLVDFRPAQVFLQRTPAHPDPVVEVQVVFNSETPHEITAVESNQAPSCLIGLREVRPGFEYALIVQARADLDDDQPYRTESVVLRTSHPQHREVSIPVIIHQMRDVVVAPNRLAIPAPLPKAGFSQQLMVRSRGTEPLEILEMIPPHDALTITARRLSEIMFRIEVTFASLPEDIDGQLVTLRLQREGAEPEVYAVPIQVIRR